MTMDEFNDAMKLMHLKYSILTCFDLSTAAVFAKRLGYWNKKGRNEDVDEKYQRERDRYTKKIETAQHNALAGAMFERDYGLIFEPMIEKYSLTKLTTINDAIRQWQPVLKKYGVNLETY